jgi:TetR/AcrR family fatty acid metabolism transcriptional regulator
MSGAQISPPSKTSKRTIRKEAIIRAAIEVFGKNSFQNATVAEIAQKASVAEGTIYQYFRNKEDLFFTIPVEKTREFSRELELHLEGIHGAVGKMRKFIWYYLYFFKTNPEYARMLMLEMRMNKSFAKSRAYKSFKPFTNRVLEIVREGQEEDVFRNDMDVFLIRQLILGILEHMVTRWLLKGEKYDLIEHYHRVGELVIHGIGFR